MVINYSDQPVKKGEPSIFLAGPTPRSKKVPLLIAIICKFMQKCGFRGNKKRLSWRTDACRLLRKYGFNGIVYVPELSTREAQFDYDNQVQWEWEALDRATIIVFWIPRKLPDMLGLTTNIEFGYYVRDSRVMYGRPKTAEKMAYLDRLYKRHHEDGIIHNDLEELCKHCVEILAE